MSRDDVDGDLRLRSSAHASLARLEAEVDRIEAWREFNERLNEDTYIQASPGRSRPLGRRLVGVAILLVLIAAAATALIRHDGDARTATVVPSPVETGVESATDAPPGETSNAAPSTTETPEPGDIVPPTATPANPAASIGELVRPFVDPDICAPLSAHGDGDTAGSTFDLHLFAWPTTASSFPIQIIGDPNGGPTAPFALVQRYPDQTDLGPRSTVTMINEWEVSLRVFSNGNGDARWPLPDGGQGYVRSRGLDSEALVAIISSLTTRDTSSAIPGFDYTPRPTVPPTLQLLVEHLNTGVYGRSATLQCQAAATNFIYRITTLDGDPALQYALVIDRSVPLEVAYQQGTLVVIEGNEDPTAPTVNDVFNADPATWNNLLANPVS
jgi:hypothetical protein